MTYQITSYDAAGSIINQRVVECDTRTDMLARLEYFHRHHHAERSTAERVTSRGWEIAGHISEPMSTQPGGNPP